MSKNLVYFISLVFVCGLHIFNAAGQDEHLVLHLPFDEGSGTVTQDMSKTGLQATLEGSYDWTTGMFGEAIAFTDGRAVLSESDPLDLTQITVMAWINPASIVATLANNHWENLNSIYGKAGSAGDDSVVLSLTGDDGIHFYVDQGGNNNLIVPDAGVRTGEWQHVAGTYDGTVMRAFLNGEQVGELPLTGDIIANPILPTVGGRSDTAVSFDGAIDEVKVFDQALTPLDIRNAMLGQVWPYAYGPDPSDGALHEATWANLSWTAGGHAVSHDVYVGESVDDVNTGAEGTFQGNQAGTFIVVGFPGFAFPDGLVPGTTYYWRIDEVNEAEPNNPWKGDIWSFSIPPKTAYNPDPTDGAEFVDLDATLSWTGGFGAKLHTFYIGNSVDDVNNASGGAPQGTTTFSPGPLESEKVYYWRVDEVDPPFTHKGDIWSFTTPGAVGNPQPANGAADVQMIATLSWTAADNAASHELYFGADAEAVTSATTASPEYIGPRALGAESYDPGGLAWDSSYAWRVDEVYPAETVKGLVWSFTTADFILVDDFESYNDIDPPDEASNRIFDKWIDGFGTTDNGALVGNDLPPYAEQTVVHGGIQSMPYFYDNANKTSEATLTLVYPRDWTEEGVTKLVLWFRGSSANAADRMYVALNGTALVYHADDAATQTSRWTQWVIDLTAFAGVDLTNVNSISIGIGTKNSPVPAGGTGTMFFDDIRLIR
ncbi:MAG: LamG domain-containing protein [Planctomycetota bacterium]|jgi:hypothetical protein